MSGLLYSTFLQWKLDFRNKNILLVYYVIPLIFFVVMGSVFSSIDPNSKKTLIQAMTIFAVSMATLLGLSSPIVELFTSDIKKTYKVYDIPLWTVLFSNFISALIHTTIVSTIIYFVAPIVFNSEKPTSPLIYFPCLILFISVSTILGLSIGLIARKSAEVTMLAQLFFLPSLLLSGIMFPSDLLPNILEKIGIIFPATHAMKLLTSIDSISFSLMLPLIILGFIALIILILIYNRKVRL